MHGLSRRNNLSHFGSPESPNLPRSISGHAAVSLAPLPQNGPVLLVSDHSSYSDPMLLAATANRPIIFLTAREVYQRRDLRWLCKIAHYIPINRGTPDVGAVRAMLRALRQGEVVGIFPEGGIDQHREESGHLGIGYLALKTGAPVVPASIAWAQARPLHLGKSLITPGRAVVRYGPLIVSQLDPDPTRERDTGSDRNHHARHSGHSNRQGLGRCPLEKC